MTTQFMLLDRPVQVERQAGQVLDVQISKETQVHGGGGGGFVSRGSGFVAPVSISSSTSTRTKVYLKTSTAGEVAFDLPGEYDVRAGHEVSVLTARSEGRSSAMGMLNHTLRSRHWVPGPGLAAALDIPTTYTRSAYFWILAVCPVSCMMIPGGGGGDKLLPYVMSMWIALGALIVMRIKGFFRRRKNEARAVQEVRDFVSSLS